MTKRETDTSASEASSDQSTETTATGETDAVPTDETEALFDALVEEGVLAVGERGVRTTDEFDDTHAVYHDSYVGVSDDEFHEAVSATFGLPDRASAADLVTDRGVTRDEFVVYLAVDSHLDREAATEELAAMAGMIWEVVPDSPVPADLADVTDDPQSLLASEERALISVWKRFCDPCDATKDDLDTLLGAVPDDVALAGVDGEAAVEFCQRHRVESAPGFVLADGDDRQTLCESDAETAAEEVRAFYEE
ncbi:thioredoxin domain-containing protein [Halorussus lipolyticus]|uniref:thioredoxin domain-containing protein n=1 Tax=Halorussus lipolyticus TaxID=3034024 RepID=UPI0023E8DF8D|nr:thioredoxin domain-containing protein [Halorussus sp. DT80]